MYPPSPLINAGKRRVFLNKKRQNHLIISIVSEWGAGRGEGGGGGENLLCVPTFLSGIVWKKNLKNVKPLAVKEVGEEGELYHLAGTANERY